MGGIRGSVALVWALALAGCMTATSPGSDGGSSEGGVAQPDSGRVPGGPCRSNAECPSDQLCHGPQCGAQGHCLPRQETCPSGTVCGCDFHLYASECAAFAVGEDISGAGSSCANPACINPPLNPLGQSCRNAGFSCARGETCCGFCQPSGLCCGLAGQACNGFGQAPCCSGLTCDGNCTCR